MIYVFGMDNQTEET